MPSRSRLLVLAVVLCCGVAQSAEPPRAVRLPPSPFQIQALDLSNSFREQVGKSRLPLDYRLNRTAQEHATWLGDHGYDGWGQSGHDFGNGSTASRAARQGFPGPVEENLGVNYDDILHAFACFSDPIQHAGHRRTLLGDYDACGFGRALNAKGQLIVVCVYGRLE